MKRVAVFALQASDVARILDNQKLQTLSDSGEPHCQAVEVISADHHDPLRVHTFVVLTSVLVWISGT